MESQLLKSFSRKQISNFRDDLIQMIRIWENMDRFYAIGHSDIDVYLKKFSNIVEIFNKKYKGLKFRISKKAHEIQLNLFLNEKNIRECFSRSASKIIGLQSVGKSKFGAAVVSDSEALSKQLKEVKEKLYLTFYDPDIGVSSMYLKYDKKERKVQIIYEVDEIKYEPSPEFQIAAFYALSQKPNEKINVYAEGSTLGFDFIQTHAEKADWYRDFDLHINE
jgi:hypothetical protein